MLYVKQPDSLSRREVTVALPEIPRKSSVCQKDKSQNLQTTIPACCNVIRGYYSCIAPAGSLWEIWSREKGRLFVVCMVVIIIQKSIMYGSVYVSAIKPQLVRIQPNLEKCCSSPSYNVLMIIVVNRDTHEREIKVSSTQQPLLKASHGCWNNSASISSSSSQRTIQWDFLVSCS